MKKYLMCLMALLAVVLVSCDKSDPDVRDAFVGSYAVSAVIDYTVSAQGEQESGSMPVSGKVYVSKNGDGNGVLLAGDVYCNGTVENGTLVIESQHIRQMTMQGLVDVDVTFAPAQLVDDQLSISGEASGYVIVSGETTTIDATITGVATKQ